jgi:copper chaperone CopZ
MKNLRTLSIMAIFMALVSFSAPLKREIKTVTLKVEGSCGMCKERIEEALDVKYICRADYDVETEILTVKYRADKMDEIQIHNIVAGAGHDTDQVKATDKVYSTLPACCKYREGAKCDHEKEDW